MTQRFAHLGLASALFLSSCLFGFTPPEALAQCPNPVCNAPPAGDTIPSSVTHLMLTNGTSNPIGISINTQLNGDLQEDGCSSNISSYYMTDVTSGGTPCQVFPFADNPYSNPPVVSTHKGVYCLQAKHTYELQNLTTNPYASNAQQNCLQGLIVAFGTFQACPSCPPNVPAFPQGGTPGPSNPNGVNAAEFTLNLPGTAGGNPYPTQLNEGCDISCVNGANCTLQLAIQSPQAAVAPLQNANPWIYDTGGQIGVGGYYATHNSWVNIQHGCDGNCITYAVSKHKYYSGYRPGVFPYGCSKCNLNPDPAPPCASLNPSIGAPACVPGQTVKNRAQFCSAPSTATCLFVRSPQTGNTQTNQFGGTVTFTYMGSLTPPTICPTTAFPPRFGKDKFHFLPKARRNRAFDPLLKTQKDVI